MATVTVADTTPPELAVTVDPDTLWPPNHKMFPITTSPIATDACSPPLMLVLTSIQCNEPDNAPGDSDGNTVDDIQDAELGTRDTAFLLRAERDVKVGNGRVYTVTYTATDQAGNSANTGASVEVPLDFVLPREPLLFVARETAVGTILEWNEVPGALYYNVIRGQLSNISETGSIIDLGPVVCIEADSTDESTLGWEDGELPETGEAFFYLVEYYDGISSTYSTESVGKPRAPGPGDCQ